MTSRSISHAARPTPPAAPEGMPGADRLPIERNSWSLTNGGGQSVPVEFEGVYMNAEASINSQLVALHPYGYTSCIIDLTAYLKYGVVI